MQTITLTRRANTKMALFADEHYRIARGVGTYLATPGTVLEYVGWGVEKDCDAIVFTPGGPFVGQPATVCWITDRHAATVVAVSASGHKVTVREDKATRTDTNGMSDCQDYTYEPNPEGVEHTFYRRADGKYGRKGGKGLVLGTRRSYHDYSF